MESTPQSNGEASSVLEQFRQQWQEEVNKRSRQNEKKPGRPPQNRRLTAESSARPERPVNKPPPPTRHPLAGIQHEDEHGVDEADSPRSGMIEKIEGLRVRDVDEDDFSGMSTKEPESALEHYERAVEKESQGSLGDSLAHYRRAYRMDAKVDQAYRHKHFPTKSKPPNTNPPDAAVTVPESTHQTTEPEKKLTVPELIASFVGTEILNAEPVIKGDVLPPCPIRKLPTEVLMDVLTQVAICDPAIYVRLSLVCKRLAYHVFTENSIWKRVALGNEFGLGGQQYKFATDIQGREVIYQPLEEIEEEENSEVVLPPVNETLFPKSTDWREFFHSHPRIRFTGVYISTVNYTRAGGPSATPATWHTSIHVVTYYRYLRFYRDGTLISLLTTNEPVDVVPYLTRENLQLVRSGGKDSHHSSASIALQDLQALPASAQNVLRHAFRGRWRLCHPSQLDEGAEPSIGANVGMAGDLHIETEGVGPRYMYTMHLGIKSGSKSKTAVKNNKLVWKGFWSFNHLTDDWSEFYLKNDKAFWFSRVKSYGLGY